MPDPIATLILTRPREASDRFAGELAQEIGRDLMAAVRIIVSPLIEIVPTGMASDLSDAAGIVFTSTNGVRFAGLGNGLAAFCVGRATTRAAGAAGWSARHAGDTADELVETLKRENPSGPLVHVGGIHRRGDVAGRLTRAGIATTDCDVYDQIPMPLTPEARQALAGSTPVIVPLFSPRTARQLAKETAGAAPLHLVAISDAVMAEVAGLPAATRWVVARPDARSMCITVVNILRRVEAGHAPK